MVERTPHESRTPITPHNKPTEAIGDVETEIVGAVSGRIDHTHRASKSPHARGRHRAQAGLRESGFTTSDPVAMTVQLLSERVDVHGARGPRPAGSRRCRDRRHQWGWQDQCSRRTSTVLPSPPVSRLALGGHLPGVPLGCGSITRIRDRDDRGAGCNGSHAPAPAVSAD